MKHFQRLGYLKQRGCLQQSYSQVCADSKAVMSALHRELEEELQNLRKEREEVEKERVEAVEKLEKERDKAVKEVALLKAALSAAERKLSAPESSKSTLASRHRALHSLFNSPTDTRRALPLGQVLSKRQRRSLEAESSTGAVCSRVFLARCRSVRALKVWVVMGAGEHLQRAGS